jgi:hypothetical protein
MQHTFYESIFFNPQQNAEGSAAHNGYAKSLPPSATNIEEYELLVDCLARERKTADVVNLSNFFMGEK